MRSELAIGAGAVLAIGLIGYVLYKKAGVGAFNPGSQNNLANRGVNSIVAAVTGGAAAGGEDSLGGVFAKAREWWSGDEAKIQEMLKGSPVGSSTLKVGGFYQADDLVNLQL